MATEDVQSQRQTLDSAEPSSEPEELVQSHEDLQMTNSILPLTYWDEEEQRYTWVASPRTQREVAQEARRREQWIKERYQRDLAESQRESFEHSQRPAETPSQQSKSQANG